MVGRGTLTLFVSRPIALTLVIACAALIAWQIYETIRDARARPNAPAS